MFKNILGYKDLNGQVNYQKNSGIISPKAVSIDS